MVVSYGHGGEPFHAVLRSLREEHRLRQQDLATLLGVGRSTLANYEAGRERPSARFWLRLQARLPEWIDSLEPAYLASAPTAMKARPEPVQPLLGGPYVIERLTVAYEFQESRAPSEIVEYRRVRAAKSGATGYGLMMRHLGSPGFQIEQEALWGGRLTDGEVVDGAGQTLISRRFEFNRTLRRGQRHEFALRSWVERDPEPCDAISVTFTLPVESAEVRVNFRGPRPECLWSYGPVVDDEVTPTEPDGCPEVDLDESGGAGVVFNQLDSGPVYGLRWRW